MTAIGSTTHGCLPHGYASAVLPCAVEVRVSNGYVCDADGVPMERNGVVPDIHVEPTIDDLLAGRDPVIDKAVEVLQAKLAERE